MIIILVLDEIKKPAYIALVSFVPEKCLTSLEFSEKLDRLAALSLFTAETATDTLLD